MQCTITTRNLFWFRRDLRLNDNHGLFSALSKANTMCCFVWDKSILNKLDRSNPRINFIHESLMKLKQNLINLGSDLLILDGDVKNEITRIVTEHNIQAVYCNEDYEPSAILRDAKIKAALEQMNIQFHAYKDQVIFAKQELLTLQHKPYTVYTPYKRSWLQRLNNLAPESYPSLKLCKINLVKLTPQLSYYTPLDDQFEKTSLIDAGEDAAQNRLAKFMVNIANYNQTRDYPDLDTTSYLGVDLRFGTISIRQLVQLAFSQTNDGGLTWLSELIWRDFFSQILYNFPHVIDKPFNLKYENLKYENNIDMFEAWCSGKTGYPIVDAGMRQLNQTGFMHNRVRMICASFLCKDLLIDWRWGEQYFARKLLDYDLASNNGNWQWCASTGCDAQPYFRIFNPYTQSEKFDATGGYIKKYIPEIAHLSIKDIHCPNNGLFTDYLDPLINHREQAEKAKLMFKNI